MLLSHNIVDILHLILCTRAFSREKGLHIICSPFGYIQTAAYASGYSWTSAVTKHSAAAPATLGTAVDLTLPHSMPYDGFGARTVR